MRRKRAVYLRFPRFSRADIKLNKDGDKTTLVFIEGEKEIGVCARFRMWFQLQRTRTAESSIARIVFSHLAKLGARGRLVCVEH